MRWVKSVRTRTSARFKIGPWRRPGLNGLDIQLAEAIGWEREGTFIELGGNDGLQGSNTFLLENELGWRGIVIEAVPQLAAEAYRNRPQATVICAAASQSSECSVIGMAYRDLMSRVVSGPADMMVATVTLSSVIDCVAGGTAPELLSIDVEGHELAVLAGLDLSRHRPTWVLVETDQPDEVGKLLIGYEFREKLTFHDYLYKRIS